MDFFITILETVSSGITPWILFSLFLAATAYFSFKYWRYPNNSSHKSTHMIGSKNHNIQDVSTTSLIQKWENARNYKDTLDNGPIIGGDFKGWFAEEIKLCDDFQNVRTTSLNEKSGLLNDYPSVEKEYLKIVNEIDRKPTSVYIYLALLVFMFIESTGFALIFADKLSDTATATTVQTYAMGISVVIALIALGFAHLIGHLCYKQNYAHIAHQSSRNKGFERKTPLALKREDNEIDKDFHQSVRIANRSDYVDACAGNANKKNTDTSKYPIWLWIYIAVVLGFGAFVAMTRLGSIDSYYKNLASSEAKMSQEIERATPNTGKLNLPKEVMDAKADHSAVLTQEALDSEKKGKQTAILVFILIFYIMQTLGVVVSYAGGFASNEGKNAYEKIKRFKASSGDISEERWTLLIDERIKNTDSKAQESLMNWQLGLQTAFTQKSMIVPNEAFFQLCVNDFSRRTYNFYNLIKQKSEVMSKEYADQLTRTSQSSNDQAIASMSPNPASGSSPAPASTPVSSAASSPTSNADEIYDYFSPSASGNETISKARLEELKSKIMTGEILPAQLNLRLSGQPGRFMPWVELAKNNFKA
ncbi:hypothetical protein [Undibacterium sp.]|uniref:hypothetical protein n=1 Tax=Undibacterium sp. TaxID=1914977 RepID=UPI003751A498